MIDDEEDSAWWKARYKSAVDKVRAVPHDSLCQTYSRTAVTVATRNLREV